MNVLVYSGPEVLKTSLSYTLSSLRSILLPHYAVQPISLQALSTQPWHATCALLVFPRCNDRFRSPTSKVIQEYVEAGGAYFALGTGAECTPRAFGQGGTDLSSVAAANQPLKFYDKASNSYIYPYFHAGGDVVSSRLITLKTSKDELVKFIYEIGSNPFDGFEAWKGAEVLAKNIGGGADGAIAGVIFDVGTGAIALWGPSLEYSLVEDPASSCLASETLTTQQIDSCEKDRVELLKNTLLRLGIKLPSEPDRTITRPLPQFLTSIPSKPTIVSQITDAIASPSPGSQLSIFKDANDTFYFYQLAESSKLLEEARAKSTIPSDPSTWQPKDVIICPNGELPSHEQAPLFNLGSYYNSLVNSHDKENSRAIDCWGCGEASLYGEAVTSTQTMLDKNPRLLSTLPAPLLSIASYQLAGRGRGSNVWLSPTGCLQFSLLLRVSLAQLPTNKLVFIQYLFALAVVETFHDNSMLGKKGERIRLKWPNDIYALVGAGEEKKKIGGILVNTSFSGGNVDIVIGCGLNILNSPPITSVSQLLSPEERRSLSLEHTAAVIMTTFEGMWAIFLKERGSFDSFMSLYLQRWLHSDQLVTLTTTKPHTMARIIGITADHGLLRTMPERTGWSPSEREEYIDLQPDGNSFDLMAGMIKAKS